MNINLTEQEVKFLEDFLAFHFGDDQWYSQTSLKIAESIISKLQKNENTTQ